jgi:katanin p60 ATPase-containing subunit A1
VRVLFELARHHAPSTIFIDEVDSIMSARGGGDGGSGEHEGSRRMKTELLIQMDGLAKTDAPVFVLCASNLPWQLDAALLRRLEKRVYVPLPGTESRGLMLKKHLDARVAEGVDVVAAAAARTENYSGADIHSLCKECAMRPVRRLLRKLEAMEGDAGGERIADEAVQAAMAADPISLEDLEGAVACIRPSANLEMLGQYEKWESQFGST